MHTVITKEIPAGATRINCPACGKLDVPAEIIEKQETMMQNLVIPMGTHTTWWVACSACKARLYSKLSARRGSRGKAPTTSSVRSIRTPRSSTSSWPLRHSCSPPSRAWASSWP